MMDLSGVGLGLRRDFIDSFLDYQKADIIHDQIVYLAPHLPSATFLSAPHLPSAAFLGIVSKRRNHHDGFVRRRTWFKA
jgi:hypothetical protein